MTRFYGWVQGDLSKGTRAGHTGLTTYTASWSGGVVVQMYVLDERDCVRISAQEHGSKPEQPSGVIFDGPLDELHGMIELWSKRDEVRAFLALTKGE